MSRFTVKFPATALLLSCALSGYAITLDEQQILNRHNELRARHRAAPLRWSPVLAAQAQQWAGGCAMQHAPQRNGAGENLAMWTGEMDTPSRVQGWYDEFKLYDYSKPGFANETGHFTQVVWRATKELGCAKQSCPRSQWGTWLVCRYLPSGNVLGGAQFEKNVTPLAGPPPPPSPLALLPPPSESDPGGRFPLHAGTKIEQSRRYRSESGSHYLIFQPDGNVVVYDAANRYKWGLQAVIPNYIQAKIVEVQPDGNFAVYGQNRAYLWSALTRNPDPSAYLMLTSEGVLRLVSGHSGATLWASDRKLTPVHPPVAVPTPAGAKRRK